MLRSEYCNLSNVPDEEGLAKLGECPKDEVRHHTLCYTACLRLPACLPGCLWKTVSQESLMTCVQAQCLEPLGAPSTGHKCCQGSSRPPRTRQSMPKPSCHVVLPMHGLLSGCASVHDRPRHFHSGCRVATSSSMVVRRC